MATTITPELVRQAVELLHTGLEASQIQEQLGINKFDWHRVVHNELFTTLIHSQGANSKRKKLREIETELFELIETYHSKGTEIAVEDYDKLVKRIDDLTYIYSTFLL